MEWMTFARAGAALIFVVALMLLVAQGVRRFGLDKSFARNAAGSRLAIVESLALDARHRLVLVRRDGVGHVLLIGPEHSAVVESGIALAGDSKDSLRAVAKGGIGCV